jgi:hypothetical protein
MQRGSGYVNLGLTCAQGDQIGRIFVYWGIVNFGQLFKITVEARNFGLLFTTYVFFHKKVGLRLGRLFFFTNSAGHPVCAAHWRVAVLPGT